jgi:hypothetical protein
MKAHRNNGAWRMNWDMRHTPKLFVKDQNWWEISRDLKTQIKIKIDCKNWTVQLIVGRIWVANIWLIGSRQWRSRIKTKKGRSGVSTLAKGPFRIRIILRRVLKNYHNGIGIQLNWLDIRRNNPEDTWLDIDCDGGFEARNSFTRWATAPHGHLRLQIYKINEEWCLLGCYAVWLF